MKRIVVYGAAPSFGGTERYLLTMYKALDHSKLQFDFLYDHRVTKIPYENEIVKLGGRVYREYYSNRDRKLPDALTANQLFKRHPEWDGIYINWQSADTAYRLITAAKRNGLKVRVIHAHNNDYNRMYNWKDKLIERYFHATKKYFVTDYLACSKLAGEWLFRGESFTIIPNAVEFERFSFSLEKRNQIRKELGLRDSTFTIGFCARLAEQKNPLFLLEIFRYLKKQRDDSHLLILGDGVLREPLQKKIEEYGLQESVTLTGAVSNVEDYQQAMDCFVLPSRFEGFGIVFLEAQAAGLECFTSKSVVPDDVNLTGHVHFIDLKSGAEEWADEILKTPMKRYDALSSLLESEYTVNTAADKLQRIFI